MFNKHTARTLYGIMGILFSLPSLAQQTPVRLKTLIDKVTQYAPSLQADSMQIRVKETQEAAARFNRLPNLKLNYQVDAGTNNNMPGGYFSYGIVPGNSRVREEGNSQLILSDLGIAAFDWEFYNFGGFEAQRQVAYSDLLMEQARFANSKYQLRSFTMLSYLQLLRIKELLSIQAMNIQRNTEIRRSIQALAQSGIIAGVDTSIAEAELSRARLFYLELSNQYQQVQLQLSAISGIAAGAIVPDTNFTLQLQRYYTTTPLFAGDSLPHPLVNYYRSIQQNSLDREAMIRKSYNPKVSLQAALWGRGASVSPSDEFRSLGKGLGFERGNYLVGLGITYNIFDNKRKHLQLNTQQASTLQAQKKLEEQEALLSLQHNQTATEIRTALQRLQEIPHQLEAAQAAYRQKFSLYRNGLTNIVDLNAALNILYRAETDYTNANYLYYKALLQKAVNENQVDALLNFLN